MWESPRTCLLCHATTNEKSRNGVIQNFKAIHLSCHDSPSSVEQEKPNGLSCFQDIEGSPDYPSPRRVYDRVNYEEMKFFS